MDHPGDALGGMEDGDHGMSVMYMLIVLSIILASAFVLAFVWAIRSGQYDDKYTPSVRMLFDDHPAPDGDKNNRDSRKAVGGHPSQSSETHGQSSRSASDADETGTSPGTAGPTELEKATKKTKENL